MPHQNSVFHGLLKHIPWDVLDRLVSAQGADIARDCRTNTGSGRRNPKRKSMPFSFAPRHHLWATVMAIATDRDMGLRPVFADAMHEATQMAAHLAARGRPAGAQQDGDRPGGRHVIDVDRQKATRIVMRIEE
jgi:hypothetical protein